MSKVPRSKMMLRLMIVCAIAVGAMASSASTASAGTWLKGMSCSLHQASGYYDSGNVCLFTFIVNGPNYKCYSRFEANGAAPYANHRTGVQNYDTGSPSWWSGYTTAKTVWSPIGTCANLTGPTYEVRGVQSGGGSSNRSYSLGLYSGSY